MHTLTIISQIIIAIVIITNAGGVL